MFTGNPPKFTGFPVGIVEAEIDRLLAFSKRLQPTEPVIDLDAPTAERLPEAESSKGRQTMGVGDWMVIYGDLWGFFMVVSSWFSGISRFNGVFLGDLRGVNG